jgi:Cu-Zn family superoxide dismutase
MVSGSILTFALCLVPAHAEAPAIKFLVGDQEMKLKYGDPVLIDGRTYVPIRDVAEWFGTSIYWNQYTRSISIEKFVIKLIDKNANDVGTARLSQTDDGVRIALELKGLPPGKHGMHVHNQSFQGTDFQTAGSHFNPEEKKHGKNNIDGAHIGDLGNIVVADDGTVNMNLIVKEVTLEANKPNSILGKSILLHDKADDEITDPSGQSGERIAGGNIPQ